MNSSRYFREDDFQLLIHEIIEDLLGEDSPGAGNMPYLQQLLNKYKTKAEINHQSKVALTADTFPAQLSTLVGLRATYVQIYSYLHQGVHLLFHKALWYGSPAALAKLGEEQAKELQIKV